MALTRTTTHLLGVALACSSFVVVAYAQRFEAPEPARTASASSAVPIVSPVGGMPKIRVAALPSSASSAAVSSQHSSVATVAIAADAGSSASGRAARLQKRLSAQYGVTLHSSAAEEALIRRDELLKRVLTVNFESTPDDPVAHDPWTISVANNPQWIIPSTVNGELTYLLDLPAIRERVLAGLVRDLPEPSDARVTHVDEDKWKVRRARFEGEVKSGYLLDREAAASDIVSALEAGSPEATIGMAYDPGHLLYERDGVTQRLTLIAEGKSNFAKSPWGRAYNIRKAMSERLDGAIAPAGQTFSFNETLRGASGWQEALGIFEGGNLRPVPGGGICQAATTLYRAIVHAGLPVTKRAPHSLYVTYYKAHGVGIDATVFPFVQDLAFVNDTPDEIIMRAWYEGDEAFVAMYGVDDGRSVEMRGPYFPQTAPDFLVDGRGLKHNEIGWRQLVTNADGTTVENIIVSRYKSVPSSLHKEYTTDIGNDF